MYFLLFSLLCFISSHRCIYFCLLLQLKEDTVNKYVYIKEFSNELKAYESRPGMSSMKGLRTAGNDHDNNDDDDDDGPTMVGDKPPRRQNSPKQKRIIKVI